MHKEDPRETMATTTPPGWDSPFAPPFFALPVLPTLDKKKNKQKY